MLKSITIQNIQSHVFSELSFHKGMNVITGPSDVGKSTIIKAFNWLINNRPSGDVLNNWDIGKEPAGVEAEFDDGTIALIREDSSNKYILTEEETKTFSALKGEKPEEVKNFLNLSDHNIQTQHESYFLLQNTPGEVAKQLNDLVGLDLIDRMYSVINSRINVTNSRISYLQKDRNEKEEELVKYEKLNEIGSLLLKIEKMYEKFVAQTTETNFLNQSIVSLDLIKKERAKYSEILGAKSSLQKLQSKIEALNEINEKLNFIERTIDVLNKIREDKSAEQEWSKIKSIYDGLIIKITKTQKINDDLSYLSTKLDSIHEIKENQKTQKEKKTIIQQKLKDLLEKLVENQMCPLCLSPITKKQISIIEGNL